MKWERWGTLTYNISYVKLYCIALSYVISYIRNISYVCTACVNIWHVYIYTCIYMVCIIYEESIYIWILYNIYNQVLEYCTAWRIYIYEHICHIYLYIYEESNICD